MEVLVTGSDGFAGKHLVEELLKDGIKVTGTVFNEPPENSSTKLKLIKCNLANKESVSELDLSSLSAVIHLAALSSVGASFDEPEKFISLNGAMTINLLDLALSQKSKARFVVISSGAVYDSSQKLPINEQGTTLASSPYIISKLLTETICEYYRELGLDIVVIRPFNHIGPGQARGFILPDLTYGINEAKSSKNLKVGNLKSSRDYTDVRDVVRAYKLLATTKQLKHRVYNICSGKSVSGEEILRLILEAMRLTDFKVEVDKTKFRPSDALDIYGDASLLKADTGWEPKIPTAQSVQDFINSQA